MSFSNPTVVNPARKFYKWRGKEGNLSWYDKQSEERLAVKLPFRFIVLDQLSTMTGFSKKLETGLWSNEVRNTKTQELIVKANNMEIQRGLYADLDAAKNKGAKYAQSVYIAYQEAAGGGEWVIGNIKMAGAALGSWIDFRKAVNVEQFGVVLKGRSKETNDGGIEFYVPTFDHFTIDKSVREDAIRLDRELQSYLGKYFMSRPDSDNQPNDVNNYDGLDDEAEYGHSQEVEHLRQVGAARKQSQDVVLEDIDDKPIDLSSIPF